VCTSDGLSDHDIVHFEVNLKARRSSQRPYRVYVYTVTDNLCWNEHINNICKKANSPLGLLRRILSGCDKKVKDLAYHSLVRPKLEYGCSAWKPYTKQSIEEIEMVQRRAARFLSIMTIHVLVM